jgi:hypothetical protein
VIFLSDAPDVALVDGSLRDIYILNASVQDWDSILRLARASSQWHATFSAGGLDLPVPLDHAQVKALPQEAGAMLVWDICGLDLNCHFFDESQIEFDLHPAKLNETNFASLQDWLRLVGKSLRRDVLITAENCPDIPLLIYKYEINRILVISKTDRWGND